MAHGNIEAGEGSMSEDRKRPVIVTSQASSESFTCGLDDERNDFRRDYFIGPVEEPVCAFTLDGFFIVTHVYRLPGPLDGGIGPLQYPFRLAMGTSGVAELTVTINLPSIACTFTVSDVSMGVFLCQYVPGCVGMSVVHGMGASLIFSLRVIIVTIPSLWISFPLEP